MVGRPGGDLLSHALRRSTIGAEGFHDRVRDGIGCRPLAITTKSSNRRAAGRYFDTDGSGGTTWVRAWFWLPSCAFARRRPDRAASGLGSVRDTGERSSQSSD